MRLVIVDSNLERCESLMHLLTGEAGISVVGVFKSGKNALRDLDETAPDVVIVDLVLPACRARSLYEC